MSSDSAEEFQRRRLRAGRLATPWILLALAGLLLTGLLAQDKDWYEVAMIVFAACGVFGALVGVSIYRCPNCETVPNEDGIPLNPVRCMKCGAKLR